MSLADDWESDFALRLARVHPAHTFRGLLLQPYLDQLRALGDESLLARGLALRGPLPFVELFHYPARLQVQLLSLLMPSLLAQHGDAPSALRAVGRQAMGRFLSSSTGRLLLKLSGQEPRRLLTHAPMGYRMVSSVGQHTQEWPSPRHCHWLMRDQLLPCPYHEGMLLELLERGGACKARVVGRQTALLDSEYDISWE